MSKRGVPDGSKRNMLRMGALASGAALALLGPKSAIADGTPATNSFSTVNLPDCYTGTPDDTFNFSTILQNAINSFGPDGGTLFIPGRNYRLDYSNPMKGNVRLHGEGS